MVQNCNKNRPKHNITDLKIRFFFFKGNIKKDISKEVDINGDMRRKGELKMSKSREKSNRNSWGLRVSSWNFLWSWGFFLSWYLCHEPPVSHLI